MEIISSLVTQPVETPAENSVVLPSTTTNKIWTKAIPRINVGFMILSVLLVFGLDLVILISSINLLSFWIEMLIVFALFVCFFSLENFSYKSKFANTKSALDPWIYLLVIVRNFIFLLNFIPFIQLLGMFIGIIVIFPYSIIYLILIYKRSKVV